MPAKRLTGKELFKSVVTRVMVARNSKSLFSMTALRNIKEYHASMNAFDEIGWAPIHRAAERGIASSVERFISANPAVQLELPTRDGRGLTPFLVAAEAGQAETLRLLARLGARTDAVTDRGDNAVELAARAGQTEAIAALMRLLGGRRVWPTLLRQLASEAAAPALAALACLRRLLRDRRRDGSVGQRWPNAVQAGVLSATVSAVQRSGASPRVAETALRLLLSGLRCPAVEAALFPGATAEAAVTSGQERPPSLLPALNRLLATAADAAVLRAVGRVLRALATASERPALATACAEAGVPVAVCRCLMREARPPPDACAELVEALACMINAVPDQKSVVGREPGAMRLLVELFLDEDGSPCLHQGLLFAMARVISALVKDHNANQTRLVEAGVGPRMAFLCRTKQPELQQTAIDAVRHLVQGNPPAQRALTEDGAAAPMLAHLRRAPTRQLQAVSARALWSLAGEDSGQRRAIAAAMGVDLLLDFLQMKHQHLLLLMEQTKAADAAAETPAEAAEAAQRKAAIAASLRLLSDKMPSEYNWSADYSSEEHLQLISADGLAVLAKGPASRRDRIVDRRGVPALARLLRSDRAEVARLAATALRHLCSGIGDSPDALAQTRLAEVSGLPVLAELTASGPTPKLRLTAARAAAAAVVENRAALEALEASPGGFSNVYADLLRRLASEDGDSDGDELRRLAASALTALAAGGSRQRRRVARAGGVGDAARDSLLRRLRDPEETERATAAYQTVILSRLIPDCRDPTPLIARGLGTIAELLVQCQRPEAQARVCELAARLARCRPNAGVTQALVGAGVVGSLARLTLSPAEPVRGSAAAALALLSRDPAARRQLMAAGRREPFVMRALAFYAAGWADHRLAEEWAARLRVGVLPPIGPERPQLVRQRTADHRLPDRELTMVSVAAVRSPSQLMALKAPQSTTPSGRGSQGRQGRDTGLVESYCSDDQSQSDAD